jgi:hypothetical protein
MTVDEPAELRRAGGLDNVAAVSQLVLQSVLRTGILTVPMRRRHNK